MDGDAGALASVQSAGDYAAVEDTLSAMLDRASGVLAEICPSNKGEWRLLSQDMQDLVTEIADRYGLIKGPAASVASAASQSTESAASSVAGLG